MRSTILITSIFSSLSLAAAINPFDLFRAAAAPVVSWSPSSSAPLLPFDHQQHDQEQSPMNPSSGKSGAQPGPSEDDSTLSISDILAQTRKINIFASLTRDVSTVSSRLESLSARDNTTLLAPLNSAMQALPRKPWEDRPGDDQGLDGSGSGVGAERDEDRAARNLARFVEEHVVPTSPWNAGRENSIKTLGGQELWWEEHEEEADEQQAGQKGEKVKVKVIKPGNLFVDGVVGRVGNGEIWAVRGVVNYA